MQRQLWLPRVPRVKEVKTSRKYPQPRVDDFRKIKQYEIFHRPFDLKFRGRLHKWLKNMQTERKFKLKDILDSTHFRLVKLYLYPQMPEKAWINQDEVLKKMNMTSKRNLRISLISALIRIWKEDK